MCTVSACDCLHTVLTDLAYLSTTSADCIIVVIRPVFGRLPAPNRAWLLVVYFHDRPVSFRYTSHMTTMFTYQTATRHALLTVQKRAYKSDLDTD